MNIVLDIDWLEGITAEQNFPTLDNAFLKRVMDILISILLGVVFLPIIVFTAILIRLDSPGSVFYSQERIGKNGRKITVYKFRSMRVDADKILSGYLTKNPEARSEWEKKQKLCADPRITRVGKWIRQFSVDEIPQLFNILKGDMSLIGPRPIVESEVWHYRDKFQVYSAVRPGITGMWQVSGRNNTTYEERVLYDIYYVRNWSVWLDIKILLRTVWVVLSREGAY